MQNEISPQTVLTFWFETLAPQQWWVKDAALDQTIREQFSELHGAATRCELYGWRHSAAGRLAEVIVLEQFSRNIYRETPQAFSQDAQALVLAQEAIQWGFSQKLSVVQRSMLFLPFMHSESAAIHDVAVQLYGEPGLEYNLDFELKHKAIIDRFGRYPHRNAILGRESTPEELAFLRQPDSSF